MAALKEVGGQARRRWAGAGRKSWGALGVAKWATAGSDSRPLEREGELRCCSRIEDQLEEIRRAQEGSAGDVLLMRNDHLCPTACLAVEKGCEEGTGHANSRRVFSHSGVFQVPVQSAVAYGVFKVPQDGQGLGDVMMV
jgi:hypothetical protein